MAYAIDTHTGPASLISRLTVRLRDAGRRARQYQAYRTTFDELNALTDRELTDLGLNRDAIGSAARDAAHQVALG